MTNDMTKGSPLKIFILFSIPLLIGNIFQQLYSMVDTIIVGRFVGVDALAAVGSTGSMFFLVNGMILGLTSGFSVLVSQKFGAKDEDGIKKAVASNIKLTVISTIIITAVALLVKNPLLSMMNTPDNILNDANTYITIIFAGIFTQTAYNMAAGILRALGDRNPLLSMMNTPDNILNDANTYITIIFAGIFTQTAYNMAAGILRALGDSKTPLYFLIISSILNIVLDLVFIVNFKMGVAGAAYATNIAQGFSALLCKTPLYFLIISSILNIVLDLVFIVNFKMGVAGAAYATNIAQGFSALLCLAYSYKKFKVLRLKKKDFNVEKDYYKTHLKIAIPMGLQFSVTAVGIIIELV